MNTDSATNIAESPSLSSEIVSGWTEIAISGPLLTRTVHLVDAEFRSIEAGPNGIRLDLKNISHIDTAGAWLIERAQAKAQSAHIPFETVNVSPNARTLLKTVHRDANEQVDAKPPRIGFVKRSLGMLGRAIYGFRNDVTSSLAILGATIRGAQMKAGKRNSVSIAPIIAQIDKMGVGAVPIVVLMSTIIGAIIAQQGAFQLRYFGAELYVVDLVGILVLREIGVLITAIMVAGRTGSAITAEIGSMKMREEVDALQVMGLNPIGVLVFPRLVALVITLPLLGMIANFAALVGAAIVASVYSGISPDAFIARLREAIDLSSVFSGLIKAPFMAMIIGIIAAVEGLKVEGSAESLGRCVTSSVVKSIFVVIVIDGLFAIFFAAIGF